jgi:octaprenyl-diphosphate synthase
MENVYFYNTFLSDIKNRIDEALEELVLQKMSDKEAPAMILARDILLSGGKRFRPILALLAFDAAGGEDESIVMDLALASEIIHTATLIHDDIYDQSKTRRGMPTLHTSHGLPHAIIAGDYLFVIGFSLGGKYDNIIVEKMATSAANLASGELLQFEHIGNLSTTPEDYYSIVDGKTAGVFASACSCAGIIAGANDDVIESLENFGIELGRAFQLVDDLLDLTGDPSMGKPKGTDVHEGKMTLPLIHALTILHGIEREQLADILNNFSNDRWQELTNLLAKSGSFDYTQQLIVNHVDRALSHLDYLPESNAKKTNDRYCYRVPK